MTYDRGPASLAKLATLLREPKRWPPGFVWNHRHPHHNAVGLTFRHWGGPKCYDDSNDDYLFALKHALRCDGSEVDRFLLTHLTVSRQTYSRGIFRKVTPEMVADAIESHLAKNVTQEPLLQVAVA